MTNKKMRIRVTLNLDKETYELAKKMSKVEQKAISRIVDDALFPVIEPYKFPTPEDWDAELAHRAEEAIEFEQRFEPPDPEIDQEMARLGKKMQNARDDDERLEALNEMRELIEFRKENDEYRNRWIKYCAK